MAFVVARRDGRYEIRESVSTPHGPRARTLATFHELSTPVLDHAERRATRPFDRAGVARRAGELGIPVPEDTAARTAARLVSQLASGHDLPPALAQVLAQLLPTPATPLADSIPPLIDWIGATARERGDALRELLRMTDRIPAKPARTGRRFPRLASAPP